jgi:hypothetical protein
MSVAVFKQTLWSKKIQNALDTLTGLRTHSDYSFEGEIKGGNTLKITGSVKPTVGTYVPGTEITFEPVDGVSQDLVINQFKYATQLFDNVDKAQSIPGVLENASREMSKVLHEEGDKYVASIVKTAVEEAQSTIAQSSAITPSKTTVVPAVEAGLTVLYEHNVNPTTELWGEFSPKMYSFLRQSLTELSTNNVELAKRGIIGKYNNVNVCIENLLPTNTGATTKYNIIRTSKAIAFAGQIDTVKAGEIEKGFADYVKALYVFGAKIVRPDEMYVIKETISA